MFMVEKMPDRIGSNCSIDTNNEPPLSTKRTVYIQALVFFSVKDLATWPGRRDGFWISLCQPARHNVRWKSAPEADPVLGQSSNKKKYCLWRVGCRCFHNRDVWNTPQFNSFQFASEQGMDEQHHFVFKSYVFFSKQIWNAVQAFFSSATNNPFLFWKRANNSFFGFHSLPAGGWRSLKGTWAPTLPGETIRTSSFRSSSHPPGFSGST